MPRPSSARVPLARAVLDWQAQHGRQGLPWQGSRDPYRVWLSEIMLQQTRVVSVLQYYPRFLQRFPDVASLAAAKLDDVLALWSGLGYYSRARNLHRCAVTVVRDFGGRFPATAELLQTLPGIGRSTAAAIAAFCFGERVAILDANVKRVLTRVLGFGHDLALASSERALWQLATDALPTAVLAKKMGRTLEALMPRHTQGMMDLGATLCSARKPACVRCPLVQYCAAFAQGAPESYPVKTRKLKRSSQAFWLLRAQRADDSIYLMQRPTPGVWAGLYSLPMFDSREALVETLIPVQRTRCIEHPAFLHVLTHKDMHLHVVELEWKEAVWPEGAGQWFSRSALPGVGLPAPIRKLLA